MPREMSAGNPNAPVLSGSLSNVLYRHAEQRCFAFFIYLFYVKILTERANNLHNANLQAHDAVEHKATHQIDSGFRQPNQPHYYGFDDNDPNIVNKSATACGKMDAAHFCNLGIDSRYQNAFAQLGRNDAALNDYYENLKKICGDTRMLPQRINIGPDRVIDQLHAELAVRFLRAGGPPITRQNVTTYCQEGIKSIARYQATRGAGIVACAQRYADFYAAAQSEMWQSISGSVAASCAAHGLPVTDYLSYV